MATMTTTKAEKPSGRKRGSLLWKLTLMVAVLGGVAGLAYYKGVDAEQVRNLIKRLNTEAHAATSTAAVEEVSDTQPAQHWNGLVNVTPPQMKADGFTFAKVEAQTKPILLELNGRTDYDTNTITKIRPRFDTRVERVFASIGQKIKKGDPLVELYSTDLAKAKSDFQVKYVQWRQDQNLKDLRQKLFEQKAIAEQLWVDTQNDELKSRLDEVLARENLAVFYEVPKEEIDPLIENLGEKVNQKQLGSVSEKARMTLRAKTDGIVIEREVVPGNYYESTDILMKIAPLDHLWVWVNVYELDQHMVRVGQTVEIQFPFLEQRVQGTVDYVANEVAKDTRAVKIRASIRNPGTRLKAEMLVKAMLEIPAVAGQTVIPRLAMVAIDGSEYAFIRVPADPAEKDTKATGTRFKRVKIHVAQENTDHVVVASGLAPGDEVVTNGSLVMSQLFEDQMAVDTGMPVQ